MAEELPNLSGAHDDDQDWRDPGLESTALGSGYSTFNPEEAVKPQYPIPETLKNPPSWVSTSMMPKPSSETIQAKIMAAQKMALPTDNFKLSKGVMGDFRNHRFDNQNFGRYEDYGKDIVNEIGFSPFRNNEALYNAGTSTWDDMKRAVPHFTNLFRLAVQDAAGWGSLSDREAAKIQEKEMAEGMSSRGGIGGFTTNMALNSAYTFGILAELAVEELAMMAAEASMVALTGATLGGASPVTVPAMAATGTAMVARAGRAVNKIYKGYKMGKKALNALDTMKDVSKARTAWKSFGKAAFDFVNPLENTTDFIRNFNKLENTHDFVKATKGFGSFWSDVRQMRYMYSESGLEGGGVQLELEKKFMEDFQQKEGRLPNQKETFELLDMAKKGGMTAGWANMPAIYFSNKITLGKVLRPAKRFNVDVITRGNIGRVAFDPRRAFKDKFVGLPRNFFQRQLWYVKNPRVIATNAMKYSGANWVEGVQELSQEVIAGTTEDYYRSQYSPNLVRGGLYTHIGNNLSKQISPQGFETFMSGFLMQGLVGRVTGGMASLKAAPQTYSDTKTWLTDKEAWKKIKDERDLKLQEEVNMLNELHDDPNLYMSKDITNLIGQNETALAMKDAEDDNDLKTYVDLKDSGLYEHVSTALRYGRFDSMVNHWKELKQLTAEEVKESYNMSYEEFNQKLDTSIARGEQIKMRHDYAQSKMPNPFTPDKFKYMSPEWIEETLYAKEWNDSMDHFVYQHHSFDRALERQVDILEKAKDVSGLKNVPYSDFNVLFNLASAQQELDTLNNELKALEGEMIAPEQKKFKAKKEKKAKLLNEFLEAMTQGKVNQNEDETYTSEDFDNIEKAFNNYIDFIAKENNEYVNKDSLELTFRDVLDYHTLSNRAIRANKAVNDLLDPNNFRRQVERGKTLAAQVMANKKNEILASKKAYQASLDGNDFVNALADKGMSILPEDFANLMRGMYDQGMFFKLDEAEALALEGKAPKDFYYTAEKDKKLQVDRTSEDYKEAIKMLKSFVENLTNIDVGQVNVNPYDTVGRQKLEGDKRTYKDIAEQYGFDPEALDTKETEVPLTMVLEAVSKSEHATEAEKELAKNLLRIAHQKEKVTFVNNSGEAGSYTESKQTVIDARWSSNDFKQGENGAAIEQVILKNEIHRRAYEAIGEDSNFRKTMTSLMEQAKEAYDKLSDDAKAELVDLNTRGFQGFDSVESFVSETMSNEKFQGFLAKVQTTEVKTQSAWKNFVDAVINKIKELIGGIPSGTVLNAALDAITAKFDGMYSSTDPQAEKTSQTRDKQTGATRGVTSDISVSKLVKDHPELANELLEMYSNMQRSRKEADPDYEIDVDQMERQEILDSVGFKNFLKSKEFKRKEDAIKAYNEKNQFPVTEETTTTQAAGGETISAEELSNALAGQVSGLRILSIARKVKAGETLSANENKIKERYQERINAYVEDSVKEVPAVVSKEGYIMDRLRDLGYSKSFREGLSNRDAWRYYYENITKEERELLKQQEIKDQEAAQQALVEQRNKLQEDIQERINKADNVEELDSIQADIIQQFESNPMFATSVGYEVADIMNLVTQRKEQLKKELNFEKIVVGDVLMLNDRNETQVRVTSKDSAGGWMVVQEIDDSTREEIIKENEMKSKVKYVYQKGHDYSETVEEEVTEEENELSNESQDSYEEIDNDEMTDEDIEKAKSESREDLLKDFNDEINRC